MSNESAEKALLKERQKVEYKLHGLDMQRYDVSEELARIDAALDALTGRTPIPINSKDRRTPVEKGEGGTGT